MMCKVYVVLAIIALLLTSCRKDGDRNDESEPNRVTTNPEAVKLSEEIKTETSDIAKKISKSAIKNGEVKGIVFNRDDNTRYVNRRFFLFPVEEKDGEIFATVTFDYETSTDDKGYFHFRDVPPGTYTLRGDMVDGYKRENGEVILIEVQDSKTVDLGIISMDSIPIPL